MYAHSAQNLNFVDRIESDLIEKKKHSKITVEKLAATFSITNKNIVKELTELAIVRIARRIAHQNQPEQVRFNDIVDLYNNQVNLSHRTSESMILQQYSTPAPIAFVAGLFVLSGMPEKYQIFEPSAGNGLLTIAFDEKQCFVNELDDVRNANLKTQGFAQLSSFDSSKNIALNYQYSELFDGIITNPPFGSLDKDFIFGDPPDKFPIKTLDHLMAIRALECMKDSGRAAIIIGGHTSWDAQGRIQSGKNRIFLNYLYRYYKVEDIINIDGHKLYSRQGTAFDVRLILISGRKPVPVGAAPLKQTHETVVYSFDELWQRVSLSITPKKKSKFTYKLRLAKAKLKLMELEGFYSLNGIKEICKEFNDNLKLFKQNKLGKYFRFILGCPSKILLSKGFNNNIIFITAQTISEKIKTHKNINIDSLKNFPKYIHEPIAIFQSKQFDNAKVILTEIKAINDENIVVAIHINIDKSGNVIQEIQSFHSRPNQQLFNWVLKDNLLLWYDNKKVQNLLINSGCNSPKSEQILNLLKTKIQHKR